MTLFQIENITISAGDCFSGQFDFEYNDGATPDYSEFTAYFVLSPFGFEDENVLKKEMSKVTGTTNSFKVLIPSSDTIDLLGTYTIKIVLANEGMYYKKARGVLNVLKDSDGVEVST